MLDRAITPQRRKSTLLLVALCLLLFGTLSIGRASAADSNLLATLRAQGLSQFANAVEANGLTSMLTNDTLTVFAPNNQAFAALGGANVSADVLRYHLVAGAMDAETVRLKTSMRAVNGKDIYVSQLSGLILLNDIASISKRDVQASNGMIHVIDTVLFPVRNGGGTPAPAPAPAPTGGGNDCVIPTSGPWPDCATNGGSGTAAPANGSDDCVIPDSGPWPACATDGSSSATAPAGGAGECVIPATGPWPACAKALFDGAAFSLSIAEQPAMFTLGNNGGGTPPPQPTPQPVPQPVEPNGGNGSGGCVIPPSGPWPPCATGGSGGGTPPPTPPPAGGGDCVIPPSGPWPPCATGGGGGGTPPPTPPPAGGGDCVIPPSGPWPPCATGGGGGGGSTPPPVTPPPSADGTTVINVTNGVAFAGASRLGMNIGGANQFGAEQLLDNIIPNPGFESAEFAMTFITWENPTATKVQADYWETRFNNDGLNIGQPMGFWEGASYEILSGPAVGRTGNVTSFTFADGRYTFNLSGGGAVPVQGSAVVVRKEISGYDSGTLPLAKAAPGQVRPGSPGQQSLRLTASNGASYTEYFDSYGRDVDTTAGKLLLINGRWTFDMWAKASGGNSTLRVSFSRSGGSTFLNKTFNLNGNWTHITESFDGNDALISGVAGPLALQMFVTGGDALIDDASLKRANYGGNEFSDAFVQDIRELHPGVIRNWGGQLGSSLDNQLATEFARQPTGYSPRVRIASQYHYSIHSFLQLAQTVGAEPWIVIPPSWSSAELQNFMAYLGAPNGSHPYGTRRAQLGQATPWTQIFGKIHIEYGNEIWGGADNNDPYIGATFRGGVRAGQIANNRFNIMKLSPYYTAAKYDMVLGGQSRFPGRQQEFENNSRAHDSIGFAPYYGTLENYGNNGQRYNPLYAHSVELSQRGFMVENRNILTNSGHGTQMALYEINLDFAKQFVPGDICNDFLTSQGAGISLPLVMLAYMRDMGIRTQAAFQAAQYSNAFRRCGGQPQRLFGLLRDIEATDRKRPAFLAVEMANMAIGGNMLTTNVSGPGFTQQAGNGITAPTQTPYVHAFAFKQGGHYSIVLFNVDINNTRNIQLNLPSAAGQATMYSLTGSSIGADNETGQAVNIQTSTLNNFSQSYNMNLQPHSMVVLTWP